MSGMTTQKAINSRIPAHTPMGPIDNAGNRRHPIYAGSERSIHRGFNTRRTVTDSMVGWYSPGSRAPHRPAQRFHPLVRRGLVSGGCGKYSIFFLPDVLAF